MKTATFPRLLARFCFAFPPQIIRLRTCEGKRIARRLETDRASNFRWRNIFRTPRTYLNRVYQQPPSFNQARHTRAFYQSVTHGMEGLARSAVSTASELPFPVILQQLSLSMLTMQLTQTIQSFSNSSCHVPIHFTNSNRANHSRAPYICLIELSLLIVSVKHCGCEQLIWT